jgi:uncharacterized membrane protein
MLAAVWASLIVCDVPGGQGNLPDCDYYALIHLFKVLMQDLVVLSTFICIIAFCFAGFKLLTSGGNTNSMSEVKHMLTSILIGYVCIIGAWVIVYTITSALLVSQDYTLLGSPK